MLSSGHGEVRAQPQAQDMTTLDGPIIQDGDIKTVRDLVDAGADVKAVENLGETRLAHAVTKPKPRWDVHLALTVAIALK